MYEGLLGSYMELQRFRTRQIEVIDAEADDIQISVLYNMLDISLKIYSLTNSNDEKVFVIKLPDSGRIEIFFKF